jgi:hypothetical protein
MSECDKKNDRQKWFWNINYRNPFILQEHPKA